MVVSALDGVKDAVEEGFRKVLELLTDILPKLAEAKAGKPEGRSIKTEVRCSLPNSPSPELCC